MAQKMLPWKLILRFKIDKIGLFTFICSAGIPKRIAISQFWFQKCSSLMIWRYCL